MSDEQSQAAELHRVEAAHVRRQTCVEGAQRLRHCVAHGARIDERLGSMSLAPRFGRDEARTGGVDVGVGVGVGVVAKEQLDVRLQRAAERDARLVGGVT